MSWSNDARVEVNGLEVTLTVRDVGFEVPDDLDVMAGVVVNRALSDVHSKARSALSELLVEFKETLTVPTPESKTSLELAEERIAAGRGGLSDYVHTGKAMPVASTTPQWVERVH